MKNNLFKIIILLASLLLTAILILLFLKNLQNLTAQSNLIKKELALKKESLIKVRPAEQIARETELISEKIKDFDIFVNPEEELELITQLEALAGGHQLKQKIKLDVKNKKTAPGGAQAIPTNINISGDYLEALRYIQDLEKLAIQVNISRINVINLSTATEKKGVEVNLTGETYSFNL